MGRITTFTHVTLDGVMQAPARPDEETLDGSGSTAGRGASPTKNPRGLQEGDS